MTDLWIGENDTIFNISENILFSSDWFRITLKGLTKTSMLRLKLVTRIFAGYLLDLKMTVLDNLGPKFIKKMLKVLAMFLGFVGFFSLCLLP